jgi:hypothetical protein
MLAKGFLFYILLKYGKVFDGVHIPNDYLPLSLEDGVEVIRELNKFLPKVKQYE